MSVTLDVVIRKEWGCGPSRAAGTRASREQYLWLRLSAYAYNEIGDYERLAKLLPTMLKRLGD